MNAFLWVLQVLLALHTAMGALWKYANSEQVVPSLAAIPFAGWMVLSTVELICSLALLVPVFKKDLGKLPPVAALVIAAEMLLFAVVHFASGQEDPHSALIYWAVVAVVCVVVAVGRLRFAPHRQ